MPGHTPIPDRFRRVVCKADQEKAGDVRLLLIPVIKFLRLLIQKEVSEDITANRWPWSLLWESIFCLKW
jgi:hypothetical protein